MIAEITRVKKHGRSLYLLLTTPILEHTCWHDGDKVVVRPQEGKLILERVDMQEFARIRLPEQATNDI